MRACATSSREFMLSRAERSDTLSPRLQRASCHTETRFGVRGIVPEPNVREKQEGKGG